MSRGGKKRREPGTLGDRIQRHQRERAKSPEYEGMRQARERTLTDDLGLEQHLPDEVPDAARISTTAKPPEREVRIRLALENRTQDGMDAA